MKKKSGKNIFDGVSEGKVSDALIAARIREWLVKGSPSVARRALALYDRMAEEQRAALVPHGLTKQFVEQHRRRK